MGAVPSFGDHVPLVPRKDLITCALDLHCHSYVDLSRRAASVSSVERARVRACAVSRVRGRVACAGASRARRARRAMTDRDVTCHLPRDIALGAALPLRPQSSVLQCQASSNLVHCSVMQFKVVQCKVR